MGLRLIERDYSSRHHAYGDLKIISSYLKLKNIPGFTKGELPHSWIIKERNILPDFVIGSDGLGFKRKSNRLFVSRKDQEVYLKSEGFTDVHAIGHPITYLEKSPNHTRIRNSLLIMPAHSLLETTENWQKLDRDYADFLDGHISMFSYIVVCLHPADIMKKNWVMVRRLGLETVEGADVDDANSYERMAQLFSMFEYVTTNRLGSHIAYGSYFGSKVSVCGPWNFNKEEYANLVFYSNQPEILNIEEAWDKSFCIQQWYPQFFCLPNEANDNVEWAKLELGFDCRRSKKELVKLLGWGLILQMCGSFMVVIRNFAKWIMKGLRQMF